MPRKTPSLKVLPGKTSTKGAKCKEDTIICHDKIRKEGMDPATGKFTKGNKMGKIAHKRDGVREAVAEALNETQAITIWRRHLKSKNANIAFKAFELWLAYAYGRPIKTVESETTMKFEDSSLPDSVQALLDEFEQAKDAATIH